MGSSCLKASQGSPLLCGPGSLSPLSGSSPLLLGEPEILPSSHLQPCPFHWVLSLSETGMSKIQNKPTVLIQLQVLAGLTARVGIWGGGGPFCLRSRIPSVLPQGPHLDSHQDLGFSYLPLWATTPYTRSPVFLRLGCQKVLQVVIPPQGLTGPTLFWGPGFP